MTSADVERELGRYGQWLEATCATTLRPSPTRLVEVDQLRLDDTASGTRPRRRMMLAAAAAVLALGLAGAAFLARPDSSPSTGVDAGPADDSISTDPPGPLYLLPADDTLTLTDGEVAALPVLPDTLMMPGPVDGFIAVVGTPVDGGFEDLATIFTSTGFDPTSNWVETGGELPTWSWAPDGLAMVAQDRGGWWVTVRSGGGRDRAVDEILADIEVGPGGEVTLDTTSSRVVVDQVAVDGMGPDMASASWKTTLAGGSSSTATVSTFSWPASFSASESDDVRIERTTINGVAAWRVYSKEIPDLIQLRWSYSPNRVVLIFAWRADLETVEQFAAGLRSVTADQWASALGHFTTACTASEASLCDELPAERP